MGNTGQSRADQRRALDVEERRIELERIKQQNEADRIARNRALGLDSRGIPLPPEIKALIDPETGEFKEGAAENFSIGDFDAVNLDTDILQRFKEQGLSEGPTASAQRLLDLQKLQESQQFDEARRAEAGALAQAQAQLAQQGGLGGGSRERLAQGALRQALAGRQQLRQAGAQDRARLLSEDEQRKLQLQQQAQQGFFQQGQFDQSNRQFEAQRRQFDINTRLSELQNVRDAELRKFEAERKALAAEKSASAQKRAACFAPDTLIPLADGTFKAIKDIEIGDVVLPGGTVTMVLKQKLNPEALMFNYEGVTVSGNHAVLEDGKWVRVVNSKKAVKLENFSDLVYNLANELHLISIHGVLFADYEETDETWLGEEELLEKMNEQLSEKIKSNEQVTFC